jgi:hypothetical protein
MKIISRIKEFFGQSPLVGDTQPPFFVYVKIPEDIQPIARGEKYEDPLNDLLQALSLGEITGGGSQLGDDRPDGTPSIKFCGLDVDIVTLPEGLACLRERLPKLGAPIGTELHYSLGGRKLQDELHKTGWVVRQPRTFLHPGFGV